MNSTELKERRNFFINKDIPYQIIFDNNFLGESFADFIIWDDKAETVTIFKKNSKRGQHSHPCEEFSSSYDMIQHIRAFHTIESLTAYMDECISPLAIMTKQKEAILTYFNEILDDKNYIKELDHTFTDKK